MEALGLTFSTEATKLFAALIAFQQEIPVVPLDSKNPHYKSRYASLDGLIGTIREPLAKHGLGIVQSPLANEKLAGCTTRIVHSSGQWMEGTLTLMVDRPNAQGAGSAITYARRYAFMSMLGFSAGDDDDGTAAIQRRKPMEAGTARRFKAQVVTAVKNRKPLEAFEAANGYRDPYELVAEWCVAHGRPKPTDMTATQRAKLLDWLRTDEGIESIVAWLNETKEGTNGK